MAEPVDVLRLKRDEIEGQRLRGWAREHDLSLRDAIDAVLAENAKLREALAELAVLHRGQTRAWSDRRQCAQCEVDWPCDTAEMAGTALELR
jgi:hypothetical protein